MPSPTDTTPWRLEWTEELSVFIPKIDAEHRRFIGLVNDLNDAVVRRMELAEIQKRLQAIVEDALIHFEHEEALFREWGYPEAEAHAQKHAQILEALRVEMERSAGIKTEYEWIKTGMNIKKTLIDHLLSEDMKYRDYHRKNKL